MTVFQGTLEAQHSSSTSMIASIEQRKIRAKVMSEIQVTAKPYDTHMIQFICKVNTGAEVNVVSRKDDDRLNPNPQQKHIGPTQYRITAYGGCNIKTLGTCPLYVHQNGSIEEIRDFKIRYGEVLLLLLFRPRGTRLTTVFYPPNSND